MATRSCPLSLVIPHGEEAATGADRDVGLPLGLGGIGVVVQLEWCAKGLSLVRGANVEDVSRVTGGSVARVIDVVNDAVERSRLAPAHMSPVGGIAVHRGEVTRSATARAIEGGACVCVDPGVTAIGGPEHQVVTGGEAAAILVHAGDVNIPRGQVAGDLDVADEGCASRDLSRIGPGETVVSGIAEKEGPPPTLKSFHETYIRP